MRPGAGARVAERYYRGAMAKKSAPVLRKGVKVVAAEAMPGVPEGTPGVIRMAAGVTWTRFRVDFANGVSLGSIDPTKLSKAAS